MQETMDYNDLDSPGGQERKSIFSFQVRLALSFVLLGIMVAASMLTVSFINFRNNSREILRQRLSELATLAALQQDGDAFLTIQSADDPEYERVRVQNLAIKYTSPDIVFLYTMRFDDEGLYFVVDAMEPGQEGASAYGERYLYPGPTLQENYRSISQTLVEQDFYTDEYGTFLSAYAPIRTRAGKLAGIIGVDIQADRVLEKERRFLFTNLFLLFLAIPFIALLGWLLGGVMASPIRDLALAATRIAHGDVNYQAEINSSISEIVLLTSAFNSMTQQLGGLIATLEQRVAERTRDLMTSAEISRSLSRILDQGQLVKEVVEQVKSAFNFYHVQIYLLDESGENLIMVGGTGEAGEEMVRRHHNIPYGKGLVGKAAESGQLVLVQDTSSDPNWLRNPLLPETRSELAIPITTGDRVLGVLDVQQNNLNAFGQQQLELLEAIANQTAVAVMNSRLYSLAQRQAESEIKTNIIAQKIRSEMSLEAVLQTVLRELGETLGVSRGSIQIRVRDEDGNGQQRH